MKSREYGTWPPRNGLNAERQKNYDPYNRSMKGEAFLHVDEYADTDIEEYYRVPAQKDVTGDPNKQDREALSKRSDQSRKDKATKRQLVIRQVVGILVGSVIVVTSYQARAQQQAASDTPAPKEPDKQEQVVPPVPADTDTVVDTDTDVSDTTEPAAVTLLPGWVWSKDKKTVVLQLSDEDGNLIKEIAADVSVSVVAAKCTKEGERIYTATAKDEDKTYSDTQTESIAPLGHSFDKGKATVLENGQEAMTFECTRCHEKFTIATSITEND